MKKTISLISTQNIDIVLNGGRISLANLIDFSHFVDLYVLEDSFYLSDSGEIFIEPTLTFGNDKDCPINTLPSGYLNQLICGIDENTTDLYNSAPINYSFSADSYEYWTSNAARLEAAKLNISDAVYPERSYLLRRSHLLNQDIEATLNLMSKTSNTLIPSARNLVPFLSVFHEFDTPIMRVYKKLADIHQIAIEDILTLIRPRSVYLPPLLTILLKRCVNRDNLVSQLIELRAEIKEFRDTMSSWFDRLDRATQMNEKLAISRELSEATNYLTQRYSTDRKIGIYKELTGAFTDAAEDGNMLGLASKPAFALFKHALKELAPEALSMRRFTGITNILDEAFSAPDQQSLLSKVFGNSLDISQKEISEARRYRKYLNDKYGIAYSLPN